MAPLFYLIQVSLYALVMWGIYLLVWHNRPLHTYSRIYLLAALVLPAILPFIHIPVHLTDSAPLANYSVMLPQVNITSAGRAQYLHVVGWPELFAWFYAGGSVLLVIYYLVTYARINKQLAQGTLLPLNDHTIITGTAIGPGTLGKRIFFPSTEVDNLILRHELAHIHAGHRYDSFLLQLLHVIYWISPAHWLIGKELKIVHEFEADRIASEGVDTADYASLLLSQSFGIPHSFAIAQSFFRHPLNRRIMMLQKMKTPKRSILLIAALVLTTGFMGTVLLAQTAVAGKPVPGLNITTAELETAIALLDMKVISRNTPAKPGEIMIMNDGRIVFKTVEKLPSFNGKWEWLQNNVHYPEAAKAQGREGTAIIQFIVDERGEILKPRLTRTSGHKDLDEEALRAVKTMPAWKPGTQGGKPVPVLITLPVYFGENAGEGC
jgi:TonB family protein